MKQSLENLAPKTDVNRGNRGADAGGVMYFSELCGIVGNHCTLPLIQEFGANELKSGHQFAS